MYKIRLTKHRATWTWYCQNPQGGGFGSTYCGPKYIALASALRSLPMGAVYQVTCNGVEHVPMEKGVPCEI